MEEKLILSCTEAAALLGVQRGFLYQNRHGRHGDRVIPYLRLGSQICYRRADIEAFLANSVETAPLPLPPSLAKQPEAKAKVGRPTKREALRKAGNL